MEKELKLYKEKIRKQNYAFIGGIVLAVAVATLAAAEIVTPLWLDERWASMWNGFITGLCSAEIGVMVVGLVMNRRALKDEIKLKKQYIRETDERAWQIAYRSGHTSYWFDAFGLLLAAIIGGYFSPVVAVTCICCLLYICLVRLGLKFYYSAKI